MCDRRKPKVKDVEKPSDKLACLLLAINKQVYSPKQYYDDINTRC